MKRLEISSLNIEYRSSVFIYLFFFTLNSRLLIIKEASIGVLNGILWSSVVALAVYLWFNSIFLGIVIASALMINLIIGAISGVSLPLILSKLKIDPALAGGVILTTITDIVGFISLLGIATLIM